MSQTDVAFTGSIPEIYDRYMGPMLFEPFARDLARRFEGFEGRLLETAAGTGRVTRALAEATGPGARIVATDLNQPMLDHAAQVVRSPKVEWRQADAQALPFEDASFDAVVCQFGIMFYPDKAAGFREARRVLKGDGRYVFSVWDTMDANPISVVTQQAVAAALPDDPPTFFIWVPFGYHDRGVIGAALEAAGFKTVEIEEVRLDTPAPSAREAALGLVTGSPLRMDLETRFPGRLEETVEAVTRALEAHFGDGPLKTHGQALVVTARA
jgi:SAM-dependent methyltransferase